ncbi:hypothetical protein NF865_10325 [Thermococcus aggregans]|uniref:Uncharacterized protein n=1 Tax=Thermococcus aggregans TaxID=110163 RepID=A0A9E7MXK5_THEAG|nr:hypothetical protein [Thermococcus aggregans]USS40657.1 hypothetical protein NF865_10325 [Thermococcus aggregans]
MVCSSACMQRELTPKAILEEIEDTDKYMYSLNYTVVDNSGTSMIHYRGGFNYDREEAFWELAVIEESSGIFYSNLTILGDFMYFLSVWERDNEIVEKVERNMTVQEYFMELKNGSAYINISNPEELKYEILKGSNLGRNPLYYIRDILQNATNFETAEGDDIYLVVFDFSKTYESPMPENVTQNLQDYFETMKYVRTINGTARLWIKDNRPIKGKVEGVETLRLLVVNATSTRKFSASFEITYDYKRPEWIKDVVG